MIDKVARGDKARDAGIHAVVVFYRSKDPQLYVDVSGACAELVETDVYKEVANIGVSQLDYVTSMVYEAQAASSCWTVVNGRRYHCM